MTITKRIKKSNTTTFIYILTSFFLIINAVKAATSGPEFVKDQLTSDGVFTTPSYTYTTEYDDYHEYDNIQGLFIDGLDYKGNPTKFFSWYGVPEGLADGEKAPAVVLIHGGGGTAFPHWVNEWTSRGYIAISIAHEGQLPLDKIDDKYQTWEYSGPSRAGFFRDADNDMGDQWFYHAVADAILANSVLRSFPEVDANNIGINGISWGGVLTNVITGIDDRFKFSVPVYGCGFLYESPKYSIDMALNSDAELDFYYANWEPSLYIPLQNLPTLYVNGNTDKQFALNIATPSYNLISSEKYLRVENGMSHSTVAGYAPKEIYAFADYVTQNGETPITVTINGLNGSQVNASHDGDAKRGILYYTTDAADWLQGTYVWNKVEIELEDDSNALSVTLPVDTQHYFINVLSNNNMMYSSPMETVSNETEVQMKAEANMNYGIDNRATLYSDYQTAPDGLATYRISLQIVPQSGDAIISGYSGGESTVNTWGVSDGTNAVTLDDLFNGDESEWVKFIANIKVIDFNANGSSLSESDISASFKSINILNAQSSNDAVTIKSGQTILELGKLANQDETLDIETLFGSTNVTAISLGAGNTNTKNKWAVEKITIKVNFN